jgi:Asp-tRNA(Asn)/Glu-tRNA(Gln) amidotransferase A subunit family amidase
MLCEELGHVVEPAAPQLDHEELARAFGRVVLTSVGALVAARARELGMPSIDAELEETTRVFAAVARTLTALDLHAANDSFMHAARVVSEFQERWDVILCPTLGRPPIALGAASLLRPVAEFDAATAPFSCFTALQNQTGQPAMTVPLYWTQDGVPVGVQFAGRVGEEELLLSLAAQLEQARPWFHRRPALVGA